MKNIHTSALPRFVLFMCLGLAFFTGVAASAFPDRLAILDLLENRHFDELDEMLLSFQSNYEEGKGDERLIVYVLETLANSRPEYEALMNDWVAAGRENFVPYLVRAYYYYGVAWSWRGHHSKNNTSALRLKNMQDFLQLAAADIARAIQLKPRLSAADALAIKVLMVLEHDDYKKQTLKEALEIRPAAYFVRLNYLWSLKPEWGGQPEELLQFIKEIGLMVKKHPQLKRLMGYADYIFAESLAKQKRFEEAVVHFDFAVNKGADHIIYRQRGINYYHMQNYEKALQDFNHSLMLWPQNPKVLRWRAHTLWRMKRNDEAMVDLELAVRLAPMDRYTLMAHALLLRKMRRYDQVLDNYKNALFYNQEDADIWYERGMHYSHELINFEAASRDLKQATTLDPVKPAYWYEYAGVLHYNLDCGIVMPLAQYLSLCDAGSSCHSAELEWARHAQNWLEENNRC